jgi:hypothetical protein
MKAGLQDAYRFVEQGRNELARPDESLVKQIDRRKGTSADRARLEVSKVGLEKATLIASGRRCSLREAFFLIMRALKENLQSSPSPPRIADPQHT